MHRYRGLNCDPTSKLISFAYWIFHSIHWSPGIVHNSGYSSFVTLHQWISTTFSSQRLIYLRNRKILDRILFVFWFLEFDSLPVILIGFQWEFSFTMHNLPPSTIYNRDFYQSLDVFSILLEVRFIPSQVGLMSIISEQWIRSKRTNRQQSMRRNAIGYDLIGPSNCVFMVRDSSGE